MKIANDYQVPLHANEFQRISIYLLSAVLILIFEIFTSILDTEKH